MNTDPIERGLVIAASVELLEQETVVLTAVHKALSDVDVPGAELVQAAIDKARLAAGYLTNKYAGSLPAA